MKYFVLTVLCVLVLLSFFVVANTSIIRGNTKEYNIERAHSLIISQLKMACRFYRFETGKFPNDLNDIIPKYLEEMPKDYWERYFKIEIRNGELKAVTYGRDGKIGGQGLDKDIYFLVPLSSPNNCESE